MTLATDFSSVRRQLLTGLCLAVTASLIATQAQAQSTAQSAFYYAGRTNSGEPIVIELSSLSAVGSQQVNFVYALGSQRISSQAQCTTGGSGGSTTGFWTTLDDGVVRSPQSPATQNMLSLVCGYADPTGSANNAQTALVFDPPSNVRDAPNGNILCEVSVPTTISTYGSNGSWYYTDVCGQAGMIDISQIQF